MTNQPRAFDRPQYDTQRIWCHKFLTEFEAEGQSVYQEYGKRKYLIALQKCYNGESDLLELHLEDIEDFFNADEYYSFLSSIKNNTKRYIQLFTEAADKINIAKEGPRNELEEFEEALTNFRLAS